jgi:hypothetical protein
MPDYRICSITEDNHIASTPLTIVCDDDQTAIQRSQKLLDRNDVQLWQGRRLVTRLKAKRVAWTMKRPKLEDMTEVEEARFRLLQARRAALRVLDKLSAVKIGALSPSLREDYERIRAVAETTLAITEPDWVATAQHEQLKQVANHLIDPATANWGIAVLAVPLMRASKRLRSFASSMHMNAFTKSKPSDVARKSVK